MRLPLSLSKSLFGHKYRRGDVWASPPADGYGEPLQGTASSTSRFLSFRASDRVTGVGIRLLAGKERIAASLRAAKQVPLGYSSQ